jgi:(p)ppGpp synthase/HD superfamily hydrolase
MMDYTITKYPTILFGEEMDRLAGRALLAEQAPIGPRALHSRARSLLLNAAANNIEEVVIGMGRRLAQLEKLTARHNARSYGLPQVTLGFCQPLADRLGLASLVTELQDACFAILLPSECGRLARSLKRTLAEDVGHLGVLTTSLQRLVQRHGIACALQSRIKGLYSLYRKMGSKGRGLEGIRDRAGVRIIVSSIDDCYQVLGLVHTHFAYVPGTFDDYIGAPKTNGYRSLHTCVSAVDHLTAEIQIRTLQMHMEAEYGRAAHWRYKQIWRRAGCNRQQPRPHAQDTTRLTSDRSH